MATIATHNGSQAHREHNIRNEKVVSKQSHIDINGNHETWIDEPIREAYHRLFDDSVKAYNDKQTREDRKIDNYYNQIAKDAKKHTCYEMIVGVYGQEVDEQTSREILIDFYQGWKDRNPNLELIGVYYHADEEGQPHLHIDYVPVAHGYKKGMETQTGLAKALGEMGFVKEGKATAQIQWEASENKVLEDICRSYGLEVEHPERGKGEHLRTELYKAEQELANLQSQIFMNPSEIEGIQTDKLFLSSKVKISEADLQKLQNTALVVDKVKEYYSEAKESVSRADAYFEASKQKAEGIVQTAKNEAQNMIHEAKGRASDIINKAKYEAEHIPMDKELEWAGKVSELKAQNNKLTKELNGFKKFIKENDLVERFNEWVKEVQKALSRGRGRGE